jgi:hypothetical protein
MKVHVRSLDISVVKPGFGSDALHVGQTESEVVAVLGKPESRTRKYKGEYYYNYPSKGLEVDFGKRGGLIKHIFCFRKGFRGNRQAGVVTDLGVKPGDTQENVLRLMGKPDAKGGPLTLRSGDCLAEWFRYNDGINFQFSEDGRVDMITITSPERR